MGTVPSPRTWTVGELLTAAKMNSDVRDIFNYFLSNKPLAVLKRNVQEMSFSEAISWDTEILDRDGGHTSSPNPERYTSQTAGWYRLSAFAQYADEFTSNTHKEIEILSISSGGPVLNRISASLDSSGSGSQSKLCPSGLFLLSVGDYAEVTTLFEGGGTVFISGQFSIEWVGTA